MKTTVSPRKQVGFVFTLLALLALGLNATALGASGPPAPPEITYTILNLWTFQPSNNYSGIRGSSALVATNLMSTTNAWGGKAVHFSTNNDAGPADLQAFRYCSLAGA